MHTTIIERILETAGQQRGYITVRDAAEVGVPGVELRKLANRGKLTREGHGLYRIAVFPRREHDELMAAALWPAGRGVISHKTALLLWELADVNPTVIDITVPPPYRPRRRGGTKYRTWVRALRRKDVERIDDIPVTAPERTLKDVAAAGLHPRFLEQAVNTALARNLISGHTADEILGVSAE